MSSTFTPSDVVDISKEKEWAANIGMMDWDNTRIVFTKRTLIEFLKYTGTTVDTNLSNIAKLPKYATFGKISGDAAQPAAQPSAAASSTTTAAAAQTTTEADPARNGRTSDASKTQRPPPMSTRDSIASLWDGPDPTPEWKPTRKVREMPGGRDSIADIL